MLRKVKISSPTDFKSIEERSCLISETIESKLKGSTTACLGAFGFGLDLLAASAFVPDVDLLAAAFPPLLEFELEFEFAPPFVLPSVFPSEESGLAGVTLAVPADLFLFQVGKANDELAFMLRQMTAKATPACLQGFEVAAGLRMLSLFRRKCTIAKNGKKTGKIGST